MPSLGVEHSTHALPILREVHVTIVKMDRAHVEWLSVDSPCHLLPSLLLLGSAVAQVAEPDVGQRAIFAWHPDPSRAIEVLVPPSLTPLVEPVLECV